MADFDGYARLTFCADQSICCGNGNTNCCRDRQGVWLQDEKVVFTRSTHTSASSTPNSTTAPASATTTPVSATTAPVLTTAGLSRGGKIGLSVGVVIGMLVVSFLIYAYVRERQRRIRLEGRPHGEGVGNVILPDELPHRAETGNVTLPDELPHRAEIENVILPDELPDRAETENVILPYEMAHRAETGNVILPYEMPNRVRIL
jgi:hypothetical protein